MKTDSTGKKQRERKLLFQVGIVIGLIFFGVIFSVTNIMYQSTMKGYLEAQEDLMSKRLLGLSANMTEMDENDHWLYEQFALHPETVREEITEKEKTVYTEATSVPGADPWARDWIKTQPEEVYWYSLKMSYQFTDQFLQATVEDEQIDCLFLLFLTDDNKGVILFDHKADGEKIDTETVLNVPVSEHPAILKTVEEGSHKIFFEKAEDFPSAGSYYIGYLPVYFNGRLSFLLSIAYDWRAFRSNMQDNLILSLSIGALGIVLACLLLLGFLYFKAIQPVSTIQKSLREYIVDKDSDKIIQQMSVITTRNEFGTLSDDISSMAQEVERYTGEVAKLSAENERVATELNLAAQIQEGQLSRKFPEHPCYQLYASMSPAKEVGGDFYDFFLIDEDHLALEIADVSGKGVPAALFMMMSKIILKQYALLGLSPAEVLTRSNDNICENNPNSMFVTVWFGIYEISSGRLVAANAGHEYPAIRRGNDGFSLFLNKHGIALGVLKDIEYDEYELYLSKGDFLFIYTDGVPEATNRKEEMFGTERMLEVLSQASDCDPRQLLQEVREKVNSFAGEAPQFDDLTMLCLKVMA